MPRRAKKEYCLNIINIIFLNTFRHSERTFSVLFLEGCSVLGESTNTSLCPSQIQEPRQILHSALFPLKLVLVLRFTEIYS